MKHAAKRKDEDGGHKEVLKSAVIARAAGVLEENEMRSECTNRRWPAAGNCILVGLLLATMPSALAGQPPQLLNYQGRILVPGTGGEEPLSTGDYAMAFSIHDVETGDSVVWGPQHFDGETGHNGTVSVANGYFGVILGPADHSVGGRALGDAFAGEDRYLEVTVTIDSTPVTIAPRQRILGTPYAMRSKDGVPPGTIVPYAGPTDADGYPEKVPRGWLLCDGRALESAVYPELYAAIADTWGAGSKEAGKAADFNLPDLRGMFLTGAESDGELGTTVPDTIMRHRHSASHTHPAGDLFLGLAFYDGRPDDYGYADWAWVLDFSPNTYIYHMASEQVSSVSRTRGVNMTGDTGPASITNMYTERDPQQGSTESRPKNAYVNFIIKY